MSSTFTPSIPAAVAPHASDVTEPRAAAPLAAATEPAAGAGQPRRVPLGEELPLFCERCGYALHGLPQSRCDHCRILHFACPECGHHQPINTLRPAAQRVLARLRFLALGLWVLFKLNFFGWLLIAAFSMGAEWGYSFHYVSTAVAGGPPAWTYQITPRQVDFEAVVAFTFFGLGFGLFGRMLLLRWRRGWAVGLVLAALVLLAFELGARFAWGGLAGRGVEVPPLGRYYHLLAAGAALAVVLGAAVAWPLWRAVAHLFLPAAAARAMLDWQRLAPETRVQA
jgi:hypothetical protein